MENSSKIRFAGLVDAELLAQIGRQSFYDAFKDHPKNAPEDMELYMDSAFGREIQARELADESIVYLIAESDSETAGFIKLNRNTKEESIEGNKCLEIARFYLLREWIGRGISKKMMEAVLDYAAENNFDTIWLGVWEYNFRAQNFYKKFGFEKCGEHIFQLGNDPQTDWLMQKKI